MHPHPLQKKEKISYKLYLTLAARLLSGHLLTRGMHQEWAGLSCGPMGRYKLHWFIAPFQISSKLLFTCRYDYILWIGEKTASLKLRLVKKKKKKSDLRSDLMSHRERKPMGSVKELLLLLHLSQR